jgi:hypothetical protein
MIKPRDNQKAWAKLRKEHPAIDTEGKAIEIIDQLFNIVTENDFDVDEPDAVNSPDHYASGGIECIDAIEESMASYAFHGYLKGNCQKYLWRYEAKENPIQDLQKCRWYLDKLIETLEKEDEY